MVKNPKIWFCDLDLWPITMNFNRFPALIKIHVPAKFHQAECSGSRVIVLTEREKTSNENNTVRRYTARCAKSVIYDVTYLPIFSFRCRRKVTWGFRIQTAVYLKSGNSRKTASSSNAELTASFLHINVRKFVRGPHIIRHTEKGLISFKFHPELVFVFKADSGVVG